MTIGFFAPLPLALMIPFMAGQSLIMGESFGKGYQYGKRKISSMTNEQFNKMTTADLGSQLATDYAAILPSLEKSIKMSDKFQNMVINEMLKIPADLLQGLIGSLGGSSSDASSSGLGVGGSALTATGGVSSSNIEGAINSFLSGLGSFFQSFDPNSGKTIVDYLGGVKQVQSGATTIANTTTTVLKKPPANLASSKSFGAIQLTTSEQNAIRKFTKKANDSKFVMAAKLKIINSRTASSRQKQSAQSQYNLALRLQKKYLADVLAIYQRAR